MWFWNKRGDKRKEHGRSHEEAPVVSATIEDVRKAVREFADSLPEGVHRTVLVHERNEIDFRQLIDILGGIPKERYYMSRVTYEIFAEADKHIPPMLDAVQQAVEGYVEEKGKLPVLEDDPNLRIDVHLLAGEHYLHEIPSFPLYWAGEEQLVSHVPAKESRQGGPASDSGA